MGEILCARPGLDIFFRLHSIQLGVLWRQSAHHTQGTVGKCQSWPLSDQN